MGEMILPALYRVWQFNSQQCILLFKIFVCVTIQEGFSI